MAETLSFHIVSDNLADFEKILALVKNYNPDVDLSAVSSMDNWMWENRQYLNIDGIEEKLLQEKIVFIDLKSPAVNDIGIYAEYINNKYVYDLWINSDEFNDTDTRIEHINKYIKIFNHVLKKTVNRFTFDLIAVGFETVFNYQKNIIDTIKRSDNIFLWAINERMPETGFTDKYKIYKSSNNVYKFLLNGESDFEMSVLRLFKETLNK
ncbi:MAG: hypothetical protein J1F64_04615 [Oscillospiraceae bacterium]|nr:hypothetical protein [Oscillospiraceae bacterium]